jgi:hypothetical protein
MKKNNGETGMRFKNRQKNQQKIRLTLNEADRAAHGMSAWRSAENRSG